MTKKTRKLINDGKMPAKDNSFKKSWRSRVFFFALFIAFASYALPSIPLFFLFANHPFAPSYKEFASKCQSIACSKDYSDHPVFPGCTPMETCGRCVKDGVVNSHEVQVLKDIALNGFAHGGSNGGASILDLHSGALSKGDKFINIYKYLSTEQLSETFKKESIKTYISLKNRIHKTVAEQFGIDPKKLYLTKPTFFSRMTNITAKTQHDEYWHSHIDKIQYGSFDYTALIYLATFGEDFEGGQFMFDNTNNNATIQPKSGRVSFFTSGSENPHHVEKVTSGTRFALTIAFTCDPAHAIKDPLFH